MGKHPTGKRQFELGHMWQIHHEICRMTLLGMKPQEVAQILNITPQTVSNTLNSQIVKDKMAIMREDRDGATKDVAEIIQELAPKALQVMQDLLEADEDQVKYRASKDLLDRAGHAAPKIIRQENLHAHFGVEDIEAIKKRARENASNIIDVEATNA